MAQILFDSECQVAGKKGGNITFHERVSKFERKHVEFKWGDGFSSPLSFFSFFRFADFSRGIFFIVTFGKELERQLFDSIVQSMASFGIRFLFFISYFNTRTLLVDLLSSVDCLMARMHP